MRLHKASPGLLLIITLLALPFVVGSSCIVLFDSGGGSNNNWNPDKDDDDEDEEEEETVVQGGNFSAPATAGLNYQSGSVSGITGSDGEFQYQQDQPVQFSIGDIKLGSAVAGKPVVTTGDLVAGSSDAGTAAINVARLLQSLARHAPRNSVLLGADIHQNYVSKVLADPGADGQQPDLYHVDCAGAFFYRGAGRFHRLSDVFDLARSAASLAGQKFDSRQHRAPGAGLPDAVQRSGQQARWCRSGGAAGHGDCADFDN